MKICKNCYARQSDDRVFCIDCGKKLGKSLSQNEESALAESEADKFSKRLSGLDDLALKPFEKILGSVSALLAVISAALALAVFKDYAALIAAAIFVVCSVFIFFRKALLKIDCFFASLKYDSDNLSPSYFTVFCFKAATYLLFACGAAVLIYSALAALT